MDFIPKTLLQFPNVNIESGTGYNTDHLVGHQHQSQINVYLLLVHSWLNNLHQ